jgi:Leucine-rich repeat (LRR) protein
MERLPVEMVYDICARMDQETLRRTSRGNVEFRNICLEEINKRKSKAQKLVDAEKGSMIDLSNKGITSLANVKFKENITSIDLSNNSITDYSNVRWPSNLEYLNLSGNPSRRDWSFVPEADELILPSY